MIVVGGHMDSWDPGQGAIDDGAGMAIVVAAARIAGAAPHRPGRTLRVALFGAEEADLNDYAAIAFAAAHQAEAGRVVVIGEADSGADRAWRVQLPAGAAALPPMKTYADVVAPMKVIVSPEPSRYGGSDIHEMAKAGVPTVSVGQDASRYFDWHHSADDTLDKIDREQLNQAVATWAAFLYLTANSDIDFRAAAPKP